MGWRTKAFVGAVGLLALAAPARADDVSDVKQELDALKRRVRELEGSTLTQDEINAAVGRYVESAPSAVLVGGGADGKAGWTSGKKPYIKEGDNKLEFAFRNQVRYQWFAYSDSAEGSRVDSIGGKDTTVLSDNPPRDRSGFEIERLYIGFDGTVFCPDFSFKLELNFDADSGTGVEKKYAYLDWKYYKEHHVRAGSDKVFNSMEENTSSSAQAFVDRSIVCKAFELGFDTGACLWGNFGPGGCGDDEGCPKMFMYKFQVGNGEGLINRGSVFNTDARDTYSDQVLISGAFEWTPTCKDWKPDLVDSRACDKRCRLDLSVGVGAYFENDDDSKHDQWGGLALRGKGPADRTGANLWVRGQWNGFSWIAEGYYRDIDYSDSSYKQQTDYGAELTVHYRFPTSNWGVGARYGVIWIDSDYRSTTVNGVNVNFADTIQEAGLAVNYFFFDHNNKITADVNWVMDNSGVSSSSAGYLVDPAKGVVIEDGIFLRVQWQLNF
jgi:hypothetical protein